MRRRLAIASLSGAGVAIADMDALNAALAWRWLLKLGTSIELRLPGLSRSDCERLQSEINRYASACGCAEGGITTALAILLYLLSISTDIWRPSVSTLGTLFIGFGIAMAGGAIGKCIGLLRTRLGLRRILLQARDLTAPHITGPAY
jgi:hypothetical protein